MGREIASAIDDEETEALIREVAMSRLRSQIAADLHDSVVQTLAGASFRLEALKENPAAGAARSEITTINAAIAAEQTHVRTMIDKLRRGVVLPGERNLYQEIAALTEPLGAQWKIEISAEEPAEPIILSSALTFEIQQILREAVANAVRHGRARTVHASFATSERGTLILTIIDDGRGFPVDGKAMPRSISDRVSLLGGTMHLASSPGNTGITIVIPIARAA
ncbi:ATP-binding protein [Novosphingobium sp. G106]|uniref:sensor histidine kinase n=1 Tax=Novosphingobium sp. G106 TaxID=2849500 RepID=UPI001C2D4BB9|nr:histidine kinase [Novosphingobium sp. G106]MBV1692594.1 ATP-binding protein [Novosphingobium sp. G106]